MAYGVVIGPEALQDIQQGIDYYDDQQVGRCSLMLTLALLLPPSNMGTDKVAPKS